MTIFGATGDLTHRKLIPALYQLHAQGYLSADCRILAIGRREKTTREYRLELRASVTKYSSRNLDDALWQNLEERVDYLRMDFQDPAAYEALARLIAVGRSEGSYSSNDLFYLAVAPDHFAPIVSNLRGCGLAGKKSQTGSWQRLVIEKPFGKDLASASALNQTITSVFPESDVYRIDHYLAKEMIQNITMLRQQNAIFEPLWNSNYIDNVQISVLEFEGVGSRGGYYDQTGALKDMVQNHLLQLVAILAMDLPQAKGAEAVRDEKVKLLRSLHSQISEHAAMPIVLGQYQSYRNEDRVARDSLTDTFVALKLTLDNPRWKGVPFYLATGKQMAAKAALVTIEFKKPPQADRDDVAANLLQIGIQPREGIHLRLNTKKPTVIDEMDIAEMEYCQSCQYNFNTPDSYEKLLMDVMLGDSTRFTRWDELQLSWQLTDELAAYCKSHPVLECYPDHSCGPMAAVAMLDLDGRRWWHLSGDGAAPAEYSCRTADPDALTEINTTLSGSESGTAQQSAIGDAEQPIKEGCGCTGEGCCS